MAIFEPEPGDVVTLQMGGQALQFFVDAHKAVHLSDLAYEAEASKAIIYRLLRLQHQDRYALKKFKARYQDSGMTTICNSLEGFKGVPGLSVCERFCLTDANAPKLLQQYDELRYGIIMPWIEGQTWFDVRATEDNTQSKWQDPALCLMLAARLAERVAELERRGIAHCDLSPGNIIFDPATYDAQFIDVEDLFAPGMGKPRDMTAGSPGYQHRDALKGLWRAEGDRFAASVLIGEMITFCDKSVRNAKHGKDSYFDPAETVTGDARNTRFVTMRDALGRLHPASALLFEKAWTSPTLDACPPLAQWGHALFSDRPPLPPIHEFTPFWDKFPKLDTKPQATTFTPLTTTGIEPKAKGFEPW